MGILDPMDDHDPFAWLCGGEPPSGVPELLDPAETPVTFAPAPGALTGPRLSPDRDPADGRGAPRDRFALDDAELSCIARTLLLDDGAEGGGHAEAGAARGHDEDRRKARKKRLFRSVGSVGSAAEHPWLALFDSEKLVFDVDAEACFRNMAEVKERDVRFNTTGFTGFGKQRIDAADTYHSGDDVEESHSSLRRESRESPIALEPSSPLRFRKVGEKTKSHSRQKKRPARDSTAAPRANKPVAPTSSPPPGRSSRFRGVTKHRWTGRYEAHLWDSSFERNPKNAAERNGKSREGPTPTPTNGRMANGPDNRSARQPKGRAKGKQVYLGGYAREEEAARAYDKAAIKYWGANANLNFPRADYASAETEIAGTATAQFVAQLRRGSTGFSRGASRFRGVTRHHQHGRWEARIGRVLGNRYLYLGTFASEEEAARAYDVAALRHRGPKAVTNFARESYYGNETPDQTTEADEDPAVSGRRETAVLESVVRACVSVGTARHHAESVSGNLAFDAFEEPLEGEVVA
jgi:hypothetical protein